jgi:hypothetical protein
MVMGPGTVRGEERVDGILLAGRMQVHFAAGTYTHVRLDVGTGGHFLQAHRHRLRALRALEGKRACGFVAHDIRGEGKPPLSPMRRRSVADGNGGTWKLLNFQRRIHIKKPLPSHGFFIAAQ